MAAETRSTGDDNSSAADAPDSFFEEDSTKGSRKLFSVPKFIRKHDRYLRVFLVLLSIAIPLALLYGINAESFDHTYNGRAYYLFFVWLVVLGFAFDWDKYGSQTGVTRVKNTVAFGVALALPTLYVIISHFLGLNLAYIEFARPYGIISPWLDDLPLAIEFLVLAVLFGLIFFQAYRMRGLADFSPSISLLGVVGIINLITILFPYGGFTPFQVLCPATATLSADVLSLMGYHTAVIVNPSDFMPTIFVSNAQSRWAVNVGWPCAGVDSLIIYTVVILVFLRKANISRIQSLIYFAIGAAVTFFINILRVVTICLIGLNQGDIGPFHNYYGQLYSALWIVSYLLIIVGSRILWSNFKTRHQVESKVAG